MSVIIKVIKRWAMSQFSIESLFTLILQVLSNTDHFGTSEGKAHRGNANINWFNWTQNRPLERLPARKATVDELA